MSDLNTCASCAASTKSLKQCRRCKTSYCSTTCQKAHWLIHKRSCHFKVVVPSQSAPETPSDALSLLRTMSDPGTQNEQSEISSVGQRVFNIPELRMAIFSELPAIELLRTQRVCRSWYLTSTLELKLQQRLFLSPGPGELFRASYTSTGEPHSAIHPYTQNLRDFLKKQQEWGGGRLYLVTTSDGTKKELSAPEVQHMCVQIICNPFLTKFWPQNPTNMTLLPENFACDLPREHSWRRMQLTSPPVLCVGMNLWFTNGKGEGSQLLPSTGLVPSGVTLGHFADMLAAQPRRLKLRWMSLHDHADWLRSADAVVLPPDEGDEAGSDE